MEFTLQSALANLLDIELKDNNEQDNTEIIVDEFKSNLEELNYLRDKNNRLKNIVSQEEIDIEHLIETILSDDEDDEDNEDDEDDEDEDDEDEDEAEDEDEDEDKKEINEVLTDEEYEVITDEDEQKSSESVSTNDCN